MIKRLFVAALFAVATVSVSAPTHAAPSTAPITPHGGVIVETIFYSETTPRVQVGYRFRDQCTGELYMEGIQTIYYTQTRTACTSY